MNPGNNMKTISKRSNMLPASVTKCFRPFVCVSVLLFASMLIPQSGLAQEVIGTIEPLVDVGTPKPYAPAATRGAIAWADTIEVPDAGFLKLKFSNFQLGGDDYVIIRHPQNRERRILRNDRGREFWAVSVHGDKIIVELVSDGVSGGPGFDISNVGIGFRVDPPCWGCGPDVRCTPPDTSSHFPGQFVPSHIYPNKDAVCAVVYPGEPAGLMYQCTGWVITTNGAIMSNWHCAPDTLDPESSWPAAAECWFNAEAVGCDSNRVDTTLISKHKVDALVWDNKNFDCAIVRPDPSPPVAPLALCLTTVDSGEVTHVFHHSKGCQKQYSGGRVRNTVGIGGGHVRPEDEFVNSASIAGGASGSPALDDHGCVIGLVHWGYQHCDSNWAVKIASIWADEGFNQFKDSTLVCGARVPSHTEWSLAILTLLLLIAGIIVIYHRRRVIA